MRFQLLLLALALCAVYTNSATVNTFKRTSESSNNFAHNYYKAIINSFRRKNLFTSPLSLYTITSMLLLGAKDDTSKLLRKTLTWPDELQYNSLAKKGLKEIIQNLENYNSTDGVNIDFGNKIFVNHEVSVKPQWGNTLKKIYQSEPARINVNQAQQAADAISLYVQNHIHQSVNYTIDPSVMSNSSLFLISSLYFKGRWSVPFNNLEEDMKFHRNATTSYEVPAMYVTSEFYNGRIEKLEAHFVRIPYQNAEFEMVIILPDAGVSLSRMEERLKSFDYNELDLHVVTSEVEVIMPKFNFTSTIDLKQTMKDLKLQSLFDSPNLSELSEDKVFVSEVFQKAFIEVNEDGGVSEDPDVDPNIASTLKPLIFIIDRPFHFMIRRLQTTIFQGHVYDPRG